MMSVGSPKGLTVGCSHSSVVCSEVLLSRKTAEMSPTRCLVRCAQLGLSCWGFKLTCGMKRNEIVNALRNDWPSCVHHCVIKKDIVQNSCSTHILVLSALMKHCRYHPVKTSGRRVLYLLQSIWQLMNLVVFLPSRQWIYCAQNVNDAAVALKKHCCYKIWTHNFKCFCVRSLNWTDWQAPSHSLNMA